MVYLFQKGIQEVFERSVEANNFEEALKMVCDNNDDAWDKIDYALVSVKAWEGEDLEDIQDCGEEYELNEEERYKIRKMI